MNHKSLRGSLLLLLGAMIWGAAFVAQRVGMDNVAPFTFSGVRMLLAGVVMIPVAIYSQKQDAGRILIDRRHQRTGGIVCGVLLFLATSLQQIGLVYTSAGKAGFLTALYVVLVPAAGWVIFRKKPGRMIWLGVAMAVAALYLLCVPASGFRVEQGDLLLLGCAVCFTGQILGVDYFAPQVNGMALARDEFLITGTLSMIAAMLTEDISWEGIAEAAIPIIYTGILSGAVGYTLQIAGQREVNPTIASLIMCLEAVFAVITGALILGENLRGRETAGCVIMFGAVILAQLSPLIDAKMIKKRLT